MAARVFDPNGERLPCDDTLSVEGLLRSESMKAVLHPGGDRYKTYDQCEQNPFAEAAGTARAPRARRKFCRVYRADMNEN